MDRFCSARFSAPAPGDELKCKLPGPRLVTDRSLCTLWNVHPGSTCGSCARRALALRRQPRFPLIALAAASVPLPQHCSQHPGQLYCFCQRWHGVPVATLLRLSMCVCRDSKYKPYKLSSTFLSSRIAAGRLDMWAWENCSKEDVYWKWKS